jgi:hypothetical protein
MSPLRFGFTTVVVPFSTWSPVNNARSSSRKHRWFGAAPVWSTRGGFGAVDGAVVEHQVEVELHVVGLRELAERTTSAPVFCGSVGRGQ